jgi:hypothetical protein
MKLLGALAAAGLAIGASPAAAGVASYEFAYTFGFGPTQLVINGTTVLNSVARGWYDDTGLHVASNNNYIVGNCLPATCDGGDGVTLHNNFFVFDLSGVSGPITSASLSLANPSAADNIDPPFPSDGFGGAPTTYSTWDVSTAIAALEADNAGATGIYADLGSGVFYGTTPANASTNGTQVIVNLDGAALAELNRDEGGAFAIGGTLAAVPEPATWMVMLLGFGALGATLRLRRHRVA